MGRQITAVNRYGDEKVYTRITKKDFDYRSDGGFRSLFTADLPGHGHFFFCDGTDSEDPPNNHYFLLYYDENNEKEPRRYFTTDAETYLDLVCLWIADDPTITYHPRTLEYLQDLLHTLLLESRCMK